jgi:hypothetical protein
MLSAREAAKLAQTILATSQPGLATDGWWGSFTNSAYLQASTDVQGAVRVVLKAAGTTPEQLLAGARTVASSAEALGGGWLAEDYVLSLIDRAVALHGGDASLMRRFLHLEAVKQVRDGKTFFNANSVSPNGLYKGLFQMGAAAWSDAARRLKDLPGYSSVFDAWQNTRAAVAYVAINMGYARQKGFKGEFSPEVLYAMHNQGAGGFMRLLEEGRSNSALTVQSKEAQRVIKTALAQSGVRLA